MDYWRRTLDPERGDLDCSSRREWCIMYRGCSGSLVPCCAAKHHVTQWSEPQQSFIWLIHQQSGQQSFIWLTHQQSGQTAPFCSPWHRMGVWKGGSESSQNAGRLLGASLGPSASTPVNGLSSTSSQHQVGLFEASIPGNGGKSWVTF